MNLRTLGICKWLYVLLAARLVVRHLVSELLYNSLVGLLGLPVCLQKVDRGKVLFETRYPPYEVEKLENDPCPAISANIQGSAKRMSAVFQEGSR